MNKKQWLSWRKIGSSDAPIILGISPWMTPYQLWEQKIHGTQQEETPAMKRGNELEPIALKKFEEKMNVFLKYQECVVHPNRPWQTATLDGFDGKILVEIKCTSKANHELAKEGKIPEYYMPQLQHQLEVTGLNGMYYFSFDGEDGIIVEISKDQKYIDSLVKEEERFWNCLQNLEAPELTERDFRTLESLEWTKASHEWMELDSKIKELEEKKEVIRNRLISMSGERNTVGSGIKLTRSLVKGAVEYQQIPELKNVNLDIYRKKSFIKWRLTAI